MGSLGGIEESIAGVCGRMHTADRSRVDCLLGIFFVVYTSPEILDMVLLACVVWLIDCGVI